MNTVQKNKRRDMREISMAWCVLDEYIGLGVIRTDKQYKRMVALADLLIDQTSSNEDGPLASLLEIIGVLIEQYEQEIFTDEESDPREVLSFLMAQHNLKQIDLREEIGSQGVVSEILKGKRELNARQAKALAKRFGVSPAVFL